MSKETVEFAFDKLDGYLEAAAKIIEQYGGDAAELGLMALRIEAISTLLPALGLLILSYAAGYLALKKLWSKHVSLREEIDNYYDGWLIIPTTISGGLSLFTLILGGSKLLNIWAWAGIFYPELYAVHKFLL